MDRSSSTPQITSQPAFTHSIGVFLGISSSSGTKAKYNNLVQDAATLFITNRWRLGILPKPPLPPPLHSHHSQSMAAPPAA